MTEGESGITGQSIASIFEFPREKKKRRRYKWVTRQLEVPHDNARRVQSGLSDTLGTPPLASSTTARTQAESAYNSNPPSGFASAQAAASWQRIAETAAEIYCRDAGYKTTLDVGTGADTWYYSANQNSNPNTYQYYAGKSRTWSATCEKRVRVRR